MAEVRLESVSKRFGEVEVVRDLDLTIEDGAFTVLLGPSGCGKTTTLNLIAGLETVTSGKIRFDGEEVQDKPPHRRDIAMVFQSYALYPNRSVRENIAFGLRIRRTPKAEIAARVAEAAKLVGIEQLLDRRPRQLSGGQQQRVALARAIVRRPRVFLLDEPLSNLDAKLRADMRIGLKELQQKLGGTFVYVTHDQVEAMSMADRIVVMHDGVVQQAASPLELYSEPANRFVAGFVGTPTMNQIEGEIDGSGNFHAGGWSCRAPEWAPSGPVVLGVRPEGVTVTPGGGDGRVRVVERFGVESLIAVAMPFGDLIARGPSDVPLESGDGVAVQVDPTKVHLFDADGGQRIGPPAAVATAGGAA